MQVVLHPKSVYQVPGVWAGVAQLDGYHSGVDLLRGEEAREEVLDRVRFFAEDCDSLQVGRYPRLFFINCGWEWCWTASALCRGEEIAAGDDLVAVSRIGMQKLFYSGSLPDSCTSLRSTSSHLQVGTCIVFRSPGVCQPI